MPSKPNILRYFAPSLAPKEPLPINIDFPDISENLVTPDFFDITKCIVNDGIGNKALISEYLGSPFPLNIAFSAIASFIKTGGVVNT